VKPARRPFIPPPVIGWRTGAEQPETEQPEELPPAYDDPDDAQTTQHEPTATSSTAEPTARASAAESAAPSTTAESAGPAFTPRSLRRAPRPYVATSGHWHTSLAPRFVLGILFLAAAAVTVRLGITAFHYRTEANLGITGAMLAFTLIFWWALATWPITRTSIENGILMVTRGESDRFDLRRPGLDLRVHGEPDSKKWKVTIGRHQLDPFVITPRMVDPEEFMVLLDHYRGRPRAQPEPARPQLLITPSRLAR
jgi:hypothetical protein